MKKPSIATTIDQQTGSPIVRRSNKQIPELVPRDAMQLHSSSNWIYKILAIAYLIECANNSEEMNLLDQKLKGKDITLTKCKNIPKNLKQISKENKLIEEIQRSIELTKELVAEGKDIRELEEQLLNFIEADPKVSLAVTILIRSIVMYWGQSIVYQSPYEYLGNQLSVIGDYSVNPAYKIMTILSKDTAHPQLSKFIRRSKPTQEVFVTKSQQRIFFNIKTTLMQQKQTSIQKKKPIAIPLLPTKIIQSEQHINLSNEKLQTPKISNKTIPNLKQKIKQSVNSSIHPPTDRMKICVTCGQARKPQQKFCQCKKRKIATTKAII